MLGAKHQIEKVDVSPKKRKFPLHVTRFQQINDGKAMSTYKKSNNLPENVATNIVRDSRKRSLLTSNICLTA